MAFVVDVGDGIGGIGDGLGGPVADGGRETVSVAATIGGGSGSALQATTPDKHNVREPIIIVARYLRNVFLL